MAYDLASDHITTRGYQDGRTLARESLAGMLTDAQVDATAQASARLVCGNVKSLMRYYLIGYTAGYTDVRRNPFR